MLSNQLKVLVPLILLSGSFQSGLAQPGATVPWITYYSADMSTNGTRMGPGYQPFTVEAESAQRTCIQLSQTGQYVEFKAREWANGLVVRYSIPDTATGGGFNSTISLYKNGQFVQKLAVTSEYSWLYGFYSWTNNPADGFPRNFYDEVRLLGVNVAPNDIIRLEKDANDTSPYYIVTLVDLEQVPPPVSMPTKGGWLNVKNPPYNATGNGVTDDSVAIRSCIADAITRHENVWVPPGNYLVTQDITSTIPGDLGLHDVTIQGAGMWYTNFVGNPALYSNQYTRVRVFGGGSNIHLADFAIQGKLNYRSDPEENDGLFGCYGTGSTIERVWVEHTKVGCWPSNSNGLVVKDCRMRDLIADGYNLNVGMVNTLVENCTARGTGDDCFAIWPTTPEITQAVPANTQVYSPGYNTIDHCTGELNFVASGGSIYGGPGNQITNCLFQDISVGCGILISGLFGEGTNYFSGTTTVADCDLIRTGGYDSNTPGWWAGLRLAMNSAGITNAGLSGLTISNVNIIDSLAYGVAIEASQPLDNAILKNVNITNFGLAQPGFHAVWANPQAVGSMTLENSTISETPKNESTTFNFNLDHVKVSNLPPVVPTSVTATSAPLAQNTSQVTLSWLPSQFATSYTVARAGSPQGPFFPIGTTTNSSFVDNVHGGTAPYYVVFASNQYGHVESIPVTPVQSTGITLTAGTFKDDSILSLVSSPAGVVSSAGLGSDTPAERTANGYLFQGYTDSLGGGGIYSGSNTSNTIAATNYVGDRSGLVGQATTGDAAFNSVLNNAANGSTQNIAVTLSNLTVGQTYNVLFLETDAVDQEPRGFDVTSGTAQSPTLWFAFDPNQYYVGAYVLGTFTATATTQTFNVGISYTNSTYALLSTVTSQLNAVLVGTPGGSN